LSKPNSVTSMRTSARPHLPGCANDEEVPS
jgi:hypothetical protein